LFTDVSSFDRLPQKQDLKKSNLFYAPLDIQRKKARTTVNFSTPN
jgi:hypothetical protein